MDGSTGFKTSTAEELPQATVVMDPFHVVALAGDAPDRCLSEFNKTPSGTGGAMVTRSTAPGGRFGPALICSPRKNTADLPGIHHSVGDRLLRIAYLKRRRAGLSTIDAAADGDTDHPGRPYGKLTPRRTIFTTSVVTPRSRTVVGPRSSAAHTPAKRPRASRRVARPPVDGPGPIQLTTRGGRHSLTGEDRAAVDRETGT